ncbi:MAG: 50S ribosomal protein L29 [Candidatus Colwellbacteria bacterium CG10_big_fil_rev_8_21_14_0_10_41_28]|uniref:Large ribosomal subunit protein uL29 n=1 Tax=Candidatus Colwellbacteria bacterium CG10_big_fil_rev_8_21_14_0_10_41_28 TaxID=1974539 RepID=A0A2H0VH71_9BACT|nr:MAG: 50S ribosomal protein L29 [Candidatus Colwellbacteria bacterium CG10_big_fil_rev_8_21_14_0_10_41_28]
MKKTDVKKLAKKTTADLKKDLLSSQSELRQLRSDLAMGKVKNADKAKEVRKKIARIMTFMNQQKEISKNG